MVDRLERYSLHGSGWSARTAARLLCRGLRAANPYPSIGPVLRVLNGARDPTVADIAREAVQQAWDDGGHAWNRIWRDLWREVQVHTGEGWPGYYRDLPYPMTRFLLTPEPDCAHVPRVRLVACLDRENRHDGSSAAAVLDAAQRSSDLRVRRELMTLLAATDQPDLLGMLEYLFIEGLRNTGNPNRQIAERHALWTGGKPTPLLETVLTNPYTPRRAKNSLCGELGVLAVLCGRSDLLGDYDRDYLGVALLDTVNRRGVPAVLKEKCQQTLREYRLDRRDEPIRPRPPQGQPRRPNGAVGSWPTSYTGTDTAGGGYDGGGGHSGGFGGSF
ncbi:hypothetical protein ACSNOB_10740 [Micromonospora sp. URMC 106]|uniref:hypothetical protein n=1 Tax=Micromonospora sp. URMC 106 TaxID=3423408 RepID=UPI003F1D3252